MYMRTILKSFCKATKKSCICSSRAQFLLCLLHTLWVSSSHLFDAHESAVNSERNVFQYLWTELAADSYIWVSVFRKLPSILFSDCSVSNASVKMSHPMTHIYPGSNGRRVTK